MKNLSSRHRTVVAQAVLMAMLGLAIDFEKLAAKEPEAPPRDNQVAARQELRDLAEKAYEEALAFYEANDALPVEVYQWSRRLLDHELELARSAADKTAATQAHLDRMKELAGLALWRTSEVEYYVAEAEAQLDKLLPEKNFAAAIAARKSLQGEWEVVKAQEDGAEIKRPDLKGITIKGRRAEFEHKLGSARAMMILEPAASPAGCDIFGLNEAFPFGGQGIYRLDGDTLTLCWSLGGERPKEFATHADDGVRVYELRRRKMPERQSAVEGAVD